MIMKAWIGMALALAACGGKTEMGAVVIVGADASVQSDGAVITPPDAAVVASAVVLDSCSPTDGPAWTLAFGTATCGSHSSPDTTISIWPPPVAGVFYQLTAGNSLLVHCKGSVCTSGGNGTIIFDVITPRTKGADGGIDNGYTTGKYTIVFADGTSQSVAFTASLCRNGGRCG